MHSILSGLAPLALLVLIVALIKPGLMLAWMPDEKRTRGKAALVYGSIFLAMAIATGVSKPTAVAPAMSSPAPTEAGPQDEGAMFQAWCEYQKLELALREEGQKVLGFTSGSADIGAGDPRLDQWSEWYEPKIAKIKADFEATHGINPWSLETMAVNMDWIQRYKAGGCQ